MILMPIKLQINQMNISFWNINDEVDKFKNSFKSFELVL